MLASAEYNASYFDGATNAPAHPAGYDSYERWERFDGEGSLGEYWKDKTAGWVNHLALSGKNVLEVGCAKGFIVEDLNDVGVDATGIDVSAYAIAQAQLRRPDLAGQFILGDARTGLAMFGRNQFDWLVSFQFLDCIADSDMPAMVAEMNRIARDQAHVVTLFTGERAGAAQWYNSRTLQQWATGFAWPRNKARFIASDDRNISNVVIS